MIAFDELAFGLFPMTTLNVMNWLVKYQRAFNIEYFPSSELGEHLLSDIRRARKKLVKRACKPNLSSFALSLPW